MNGKSVPMAYTDQFLEAEIAKLECAVERWARSRNLWFDCGFMAYLEHVDAEPTSPPTVSMMWFEGPLYNVLSQFADDALYEEFNDLIASLGYEHENLNGTTLAFYPVDQFRSTAFEEYFNWKWICGLIEPDCADVYQELYSHFAARPADLHHLDWRQFEILLFRIFRNHGFQAQLGPGRGDDGVDIRLIQRDPLGDILTLVQAKKYAPNRKIKLEAVQALHGAANIEKAGRTIFVTTSGYEPVARRWAARTSGRMQLATSEDVVAWCACATETIIRDKSSLVTKDRVSQILRNSQGTERNRVVHARTGFGMITNQFALVIKESNHAALLMALPSKAISDDGYGQRGLGIPVLDGTALSKLRGDSVWRVKRKIYDGRVHYWDGRNLYDIWDGVAAPFDLCD